MRGSASDGQVYDRLASAPPKEDEVAAEAESHDDSQLLSESGIAQPLIQDVHATTASVRAPPQEERLKRSKWRHTLGIIMLFVTVLLWTASSFLASTMFADDSYSKPYFVTYINASFFGIPLVPALARRLNQHPEEWTELTNGLRGMWTKCSSKLRLARRQQETLPFLHMDGEGDEDPTKDSRPDRRAHSPQSPLEVEEFQPNHRAGSLSLLETTKVSLEFCSLWFLANYFNAACLEYTTVSSSTILSSTSSIWTLLCGALVGVERFTIRKLLGVLLSLAGIVLISSMDVTGESEEDRGSFPYKSPKEVAIGDAMAFVSALMYGFYAVLMKKRIGDEGRVNMPLFFGIVGTFNVLLSWPGLILVHVTGIEKFELPPSGYITMIIVINSLSSLVSDMCWAYAVLLTSPLIVTIGLSLTIPLSLIGQMVLDAQYSSPVYWIGAGAVVASFIFINHEGTKELEADTPSASAASEP